MSMLQERVRGNIMNTYQESVSGLQQRVRKTKETYGPKVRKLITGNTHTKVRVHLKQPRVIRLIDRISFFVSVNLMMLCAYFFLAEPGYFRYFYLPVMTALMWLRLKMYYERKYALFMLDFCYFVQPVTMMLLLVAPNCKALFHTCYALSFGPLSVAILMWRNSLVFHDVDKVTSVAIHIMLPLQLYCLKHGEPLYSEPQFQITSLVDLMLHYFAYPVLFYCCWQAFYLVVTEGLLASWLKRNPEQVTSLRWLGTDEKSGLYKATERLWKKKLGFFGPNEKLSDLSPKSLFVFVLTQMMFTVTTLIVPAIVVWSKYLENFWLGVLFSLITWNGASFYIEVFSRRYAPEAFAEAVPDKST